MNWHVLRFIWTRSLFLANYVVIGAIAVFGSHGVTWRDMVILAKSRQVARHLPDVGANLENSVRRVGVYRVQWFKMARTPSR